MSNAVINCIPQHLISDSYCCINFSRKVGMSCVLICHVAHIISVVVHTFFSFLLFFFYTLQCLFCFEVQVHSVTDSCTQHVLIVEQIGIYLFIGFITIAELCTCTCNFGQQHQVGLTLSLRVCLYLGPALG